MTVIYAKYSRQRLPKFQIETTIVLLENGTRLIRKKPGCPEAQEHINRMLGNYSILKNVTTGLNIVEARAEGNGLIYDYVEGKSLDKILFELIRRRNKEMLQAKIREYANLIKSAVPGNKVTSFSPTPEYVEVFGNAFSGKRMYCLEYGNADLIFENVILDDGGKYNVIDYEWIFSFPIPLDIILYRSAIVLWYKYYEYLHGLLTWEELMSCAGLRVEDEQVLRQADVSFQAYVYGEGSKYWISPKYQKTRSNLNEMVNKLESLERTKTELERVIDHKNAVLADKDALLAEKDMDLKEKQKRITEITETLNDIYNSRSWRTTNKIRQIQASLLKRKK